MPVRVSRRAGTCAIIWATSAVIWLTPAPWDPLPPVDTTVILSTLDSGSAMELPANKGFAILTLVGSLVLTLLVWVPVLGGMR